MTSFKEARRAVIQETKRAVIQKIIRAVTQKTRRAVMQETRPTVIRFSSRVNVCLQMYHSLSRALSGLFSQGGESFVD